MTVPHFCVQDGREYKLGVSIFNTSDGVGDMVWGLAAIEASRDFAMLFLTVLASA